MRKNAQTASFDVKNRVLVLPILKNGTSDAVEEMMMVHEVGHAKHTSMDLLLDSHKKGIKGYVNIVEDVRIERLMKEEYPGTRKSFSIGYKELNDLDFFGVKKKDLSKTPLLLIDKINLYYKVGYNCGVQFNDEEMMFVKRCQIVESTDDVLDLATDIWEYSKRKGKEDNDHPMAEDQPPQFGKKPPDDSGMDSDESDEEDGEYGGESDSDGGKESDSSKDSKGKSKKGSGKAESDEEGAKGKGADDGKGDGEGKDGKGKGKPGLDFETNRPIQQDSQVGKGASRSGGGGIPQPLSDQQLESETLHVFEGNMASLADRHASFDYYNINPTYGSQIVVPYKQVLADTQTLDTGINSHRAQIDDIKAETKLSIAFLMKEFEMKKAAKVNKRVTVAKTGSLAGGKLFAYKLKDDIFKRMSQVPKGENHGMVMLIDWSGSMGDNVHDCVRQAIDIASFCRLAQIPFEVFAFTSGYRGRTNDYKNGTLASKVSKAESAAVASKTGLPGSKLLRNGDGDFHLLQFLSSDMSNTEFNRMTDRLLTRRVLSVAGYGLGGTPLNEALVYFIDFLPKFKEKNMLEKVCFITLTDGQGTPLMRNNYSSSGGYNTYTQPTKAVIVDPSTKKHYDITNGYDECHTLLNLIRDKSGAKSIGYHIMDSMSDVSSCVSIYSKVEANEKQLAISKAHDAITKTGVGEIPSPSRDLQLLVHRSGMVASTQTLNISAQSSVESISKNLAKVMNTRKSNRIVLERFIDTIA